MTAFFFLKERGGGGEGRGDGNAAGNWGGKKGSIT